MPHLQLQFLYMCNLELTDFLMNYFMTNFTEILTAHLSHHNLSAEQWSQLLLDEEDSTFSEQFKLYDRASTPSDSLWWKYKYDLGENKVHLVGFCRNMHELDIEDTISIFHFLASQPLQMIDHQFSVLR